MDEGADRVILDVYRKIEREKVIIQGARSVRQSTQNSSVQARCDTQIREAQNNITYLEETMRQLKLRAQPGAGAHGPGGSTGSGATGISGGGSTRADGSGSGPGSSSGSGRGGVGDSDETQVAPGPRPAQVRANFTRLDLLKYDNPNLGPRIQLMLQQLEFKLSVEKQYKEGIDKMLKLYKLEGDRRSKAEAEEKRLESTQKIQLLRKSLKRYSDMHIDINEDLGDDSESLAASNLRRPLTGNLHIACHAIKDADHVSSGRLGRSPETFVTIKVEDQTRAKTKASRTDRWLEDFDLPVDKANEIELVVYDRTPDRDVPIGMMWLRISDIAEALRRKKVEMELNNEGWVSAARVQQTPSDSYGLDNDNLGRGNNGGAGTGAGAYNNGNGGNGAAGGGGPGGGPTGGPGGVAAGPAGAGLNGVNDRLVIDSWFVLEPAGQIQLSLGFDKSNRGVKRAYDGVGGLGRQGAIRQKKEDVHEVHGHKFAPHQFYNIMRCALCGDFLKYSGGYQCMDCKYTCHKKCYPKVVTKCISKSSTELDPDEEKLNHRIPHRFEAATNMSANWCCHCGYILPLGKKTMRKCTECGVTSHAQCVHLVPDFCGMSMEMANNILRTIRDTKVRQQQLHKPATQAAQSVLSVQSSHASQGLSPYGSQPPQAQTQAHSQHGAQHGTSHLPHSGSFSQPVAPTPPPREPVRRREVGSVSSPAPAPARRDENAVAAAAAAATVAAAASGRPLSQQQQQQQQQQQPHAQHQVQQPAAPVQAPVQQVAQAHTAPATQAPVPSPRNDARIAPVAATTPSTGAVVASSPATAVSAVKKSRKKVGLDDFNFLAVLGKGNFGKVMLAESKQLKRLYAIKVLKKDFIIEHDEVESTRSEKRVLLIATREQHPFLLNLYSSFQTENRVYFVMEYISGGDLMWHIQKMLFTPRRAQFYAAEVLLALKYFHDSGVIYRDLKLDNILLTLEGHIKIVDYGLCKEDMWYGKTTGTFCGTPEFMAPEILLEQKYGRAVDWWAFGVLLYQMLLGKSPFRGEDDDEVFDAILTDEPLYPIHMPRDSVSILQQLLTRDPEKRLGSGPKDAEEIMAHPYFHNINFDDIYHCRVAPPFIPKVDSPTDVRNFDQEFTTEVPALTPVTTTLTPAMQEQFRGFSYLNGDAI